MISEGSCDTEDWSNDAENSDHRNKLHFKIYVIFHSFNSIFDPINTAFVSMTHFLQKHKIK